MNHGSMHISLNQKNNWIYGSKSSQIQQKLFVEETHVNKLLPVSLALAVTWSVRATSDGEFPIL